MRYLEEPILRSNHPVKKSISRSSKLMEQLCTNEIRISSCENQDPNRHMCPNKLAFTWEQVGSCTKSLAEVGSRSWYEVEFEVVWKLFIVSRLFDVQNQC